MLLFISYKLDVSYVSICIDVFFVKLASREKAVKTTLDFIGSCQVREVTSNSLRCGMNGFR